MTAVQGELGSEAPEPVKHTEASVLALLRKRHAPKQEGIPEYAYMEHVRNAGSWDATRTADAMALSLWKSRGYELAGFEVKVSRSDWRKELSDASKAEVWTDVVDRWWIVAPKGIVPVDELPAPWGLMEVATVRKVEKLVVTKPAPLLTTQRHDIKRSFLVPLLRAAGGALKVSPDKLALDEARKEGRVAADQEIANLKKTNDEYFTRLKESQQVVREIEQVLGCRLGDWVKADTERAKEVAAHLRAVLAGDEQITRARKRVESAADQLEQAAKTLLKAACLGSQTVSWPVASHRLRSSNAAQFVDPIPQLLVRGA